MRRHGQPASGPIIGDAAGQKRAKEAEYAQEPQIAHGAEGRSCEARADDHEDQCEEQQQVGRSQICKGHSEQVPGQQPAARKHRENLQADRRAARQGACGTQRPRRAHGGGIRTEGGSNRPDRALYHALHSDGAGLPAQMFVGRGRYAMGLSPDPLGVCAPIPMIHCPAGCQAYPVAMENRPFLFPGTSGRGPEIDRSCTWSAER